MALNPDLHKRHSHLKLQEIGRELYAQKKYEEAIEALTASIRASNSSPDVSLFALRAAAYEKLGKLSMALKDGRQMIDQAAENAKGYFITAGLLKRMQNNALAEKICQRGLRYCKKPADLEKLQRKLTELRGAPHSPTIDPLEVLPSELIEMVFGYVSFTTLCSSIKVSKLWRTQLKAHHGLWTHIDTSSARSAVRSQDFRDSVKNSQRKLTDATLKNVQIQGSKNLEFLTKASPTLRSLSLLSGGELSDSLIRALAKASNLQVLKLIGNVSVTSDTVRVVVVACQNLREFHCQFLRAARGPIGPVAPYLESLSLLGLDLVMPVDTRSIILPGRRLRRLTCKSTGYASEPGAKLVIHHSYLKAVESLEELELESCDISNRAIAEHANSLRTLKFKETRFGNDILISDWFEGQSETGQCFPNLEEFSLEPIIDSHRLDVFLRIFDPGCTKFLRHLERLRLDASLWEEDQLQSLLEHPRTTRLKHLWLTNCRSLVDNRVNSVIQNTSKLISLGVPGCRLTGVGVKALVTQLHHLKNLDVSDCVDVGRDAVMWARKQGVKTIFQLSQAVR